MLTNTEIRNAKGKEKPYKMADSQGLYLLVRPNGSKHWHLKYRIGGKERKLSFGAYPEVSLSEARQAKEAARTELRAGIDPGLTQKQKKASAANDEGAFRRVAERWIEHTAPTWRSVKHHSDVVSSLERYVYPAIGNVPLNEITSPMVLALLKRVEAQRAIETAHRVCQRISAVFLYGIACGLAQTDPAAPLRAILKKVPKGRQSAITNLPELQEMMAHLDGVAAYPVSLLALRFLALTATRSGEIRGMLWSELNCDVWEIPAERMKMKRSHIVPLSRQALDVLDAVRPFTGHAPYVFAAVRSPKKPMSDMALSMILKRNGYAGRHVPHGFRSSFSSIMNERRPEDRYVIDLMLAHVSKDKVEAAYNRSLHLEKRKEIAQEWADLLLEKCAPASALTQIPSRPAFSPPPSELPPASSGDGHS
ncbi:phage integrase central domain-containing protein [Parasaccharibacter sp. TMW2.1890]|uniref:tyrosine-type recombinase/integrase n=1 Tax=Parasaccharibacter sp. TMW2.1890 TaxID=2039289 RepID=UPI0020313FFE|nr:integrase arm-type DNA-binding domain-containing protein [Parasaccharibacter sp. TMW2.1890]MCL1515178.1 integrase [Parasaccharibacter sp. TMW2.1890]